MNQEEINIKIVEDIEHFLRNLGDLGNCFTSLYIFFNGLAYTYGENNERIILENKNPNDYFEYGSPKTVSMCFENSELIGIFSNGENMEKLGEFEDILEKHGYYFEMGHHWNLSIYSIED